MQHWQVYVVTQSLWALSNIMRSTMYVATMYYVAMAAHSDLKLRIPFWNWIGKLKKLFLINLICSCVILYSQMEINFSKSPKFAKIAKAEIAKQTYIATFWLTLFKKKIIFDVPKTGYFPNEILEIRSLS